MLMDHALYEFHKAQAYAFANDPKAIDAINRAIELRTQAYDALRKSSDEGHSEEEAFIIYLRATRDFLEGDIEALQREYDLLVQKDPKSRNTQIIRSLTEDLKNRSSSSNYYYRLFSSESDYGPHGNQ